MQKNWSPHDDLAVFAEWPCSPALTLSPCGATRIGAVGPHATSFRAFCFELQILLEMPLEHVCEVGPCSGLEYPFPTTANRPMNRAANAFCLATIAVTLWRFLSQNPNLKPNQGSAEATFACRLEFESRFGHRIRIPIPPAISDARKIAIFAAA